MPATQTTSEDRARADRRAGWRVIGAAVARHKGWVAFGILAGVVWTAARVSVPRLTGQAIDLGIEAADGGALALWVGLLAIAGLVQATTTGARRYAAFRMAHRVETDLRDRLAAHLQRLDFSFHDRASTGQLMANAATDIQQIFTSVLLIPLTVASMLTGLTVVVILVLLDPGLAFFGLVSLPLLNLVSVRFTRRMFPVGLGLQEELAELSGVVEESVAGVRVVKGFGAEELQIGRLDREAGDVYERGMQAARLRAWFLPVVDLLPTLGLVGILWYGGHQVIDGDLTVGDVIAANFYVLMLIWPLRMLGMLLGQLPRAAASGGRIAEVLATEREVLDPRSPRPLPDGPGEVRFEGVVFGYGEGSPVLDGLDLVVRGGEAVALVGATGSGKSTVARLLPRFYDVDAGAVRLDGVDVRELSIHEVRRAVGVVFEDTFLFSASVRDNVAFAAPEVDDETVRRAARLAGADTFVQSLPEGYDAVLGEHGYSLSGGQRQRIAIARAIVADPRVLVLDDATSAVDPSKEHEIRSALGEVMAGRTTIIIAHRPATIALADRVVLLDGGRIVADGTHDELLVNSSRYREVLARAEASDHSRRDQADGGDEADRGDEGGAPEPAPHGVGP